VRLVRTSETNGHAATKRTKRRSVNRWKDKLGIVASVTCAVHCAATPILLACLPALKFTEWMASPQFHQVAAIICVGLVAMSIWPAFRKFRDYRVLGLSSAGLVLIVAAAFVLPDHCCSHTEVAGDLPLATAGLGGKVHLVSSSKTVSESEAVCTDGCCSDSVFAKRRALLGGSGSIATGNPGPQDPTSHDHASHDHSSHEHTDFASALFGNIFVATVQPWLTPIGGVLLVMAHAFNLSRRRTSCGSAACGCPGSSVSDSASSISDLPILQNIKAA